MNKIIGLAGVAGSGKDTFYSLLSKSFPCTKYSLASELKKEVNQWCKLHYGIDSVNCTREEKELIREFLVFHGVFKRKQTDGRYWIEKLNEIVIKDKTNNFKVITDIRYDDHENDEVSWLKNELGGCLVHISQYLPFTQVTKSKGKTSVSERILKKYRSPANSEEARNDPKIKEKSDFQVEWEFLKTGQIDELQPYVDEFIKCQQQKQKTL